MSQIQDYETDEEELVVETEGAWKRKKEFSNPNKKRKANSSPKLTTQPKMIDNSDNSNQTNRIEKRDPRPPPIIVTNITNYQKL